MMLSGQASESAFYVLLRPSLTGYPVPPKIRKVSPSEPLTGQSFCHHQMVDKIVVRGVAIDRAHDRLLGRDVRLRPTIVQPIKGDVDNTVPLLVR
jgi:hypothetical protein